MIAVDSVEEHINRVSEFGGKIHMGPNETPGCVGPDCSSKPQLL